MPVANYDGAMSFIAPPSASFLLVASFNFKHKHSMPAYMCDCPPGENVALMHGFCAILKYPYEHEYILLCLFV